MENGAGNIILPFDTSRIGQEKSIKAAKQQAENMGRLFAQSSNHTEHINVLYKRIVVLEQRLVTVAQIAVSNRLYALNLAPFAELKRYAKELKVKAEKGWERADFIGAIAAAEDALQKPEVPEKEAVGDGTGQEENSQEDTEKKIPVQL